MSARFGDRGMTAPLTPQARSSTVSQAELETLPCSCVIVELPEGLFMAAECQNCRARGAVYKRDCIVCETPLRQHTTKELDTCLSRVFAEVHSQGLEPAQAGGRVRVIDGSDANAPAQGVSSDALRPRPEGSNPRKTSEYDPSDVGVQE